MNMQFKRKLPNYHVVRDMYPLTSLMMEKKKQNDKEIQRIFCSEDDRLILIIGPCSADREDAVLEYINRLCDVQEKVKDKILIVPRIYTNKPRTTGVGYMGMLHQPDPKDEEDILKGLIASRKLHLRCLESSGFSGADEMLYPENQLYLADAISYVSVGARSVENQQHRLTASGLDVPVGMKNPTSGDLGVMLNAVTSAQNPHTFVYNQWEVKSNGNPTAHAILRGSVNEKGEYCSNYHYDDLMNLIELYEKRELKNPAVIIDTNHGNSGKNWEKQPEIAMEVLKSMTRSKEVLKLVKGLMIESYIEDGCQKPEEGTFGKSITDPCLGWEKTEKLIYQLADLR